MVKYQTTITGPMVRDIEDSAAFIKTARRLAKALRLHLRSDGVEVLDLPQILNARESVDVKQQTIISSVRVTAQWWPVDHCYRAIATAWYHTREKQ